MLINARAHSDTLETVSKSVLELKQKMECAGPKRRRYTSQTSQTSTGTQVTNLSDDSSQPTTPMEGNYYGYGISNRPVFTLGSQEEDQRSTKAYSPFGNGAKINRPNFDSVSEARRNQLKARRMRSGRRQSESCVGNNVLEETVCPHSLSATCMSHMPMQEEIGEEGEMFSGTNSNNHLMFGYHNSANSMQGGRLCAGVHGPRNALNNVPVQQFKPRANSLDTLDSIRAPHEYETPDVLQKRDTLVRIENDRICTRMSRKRPSSVSSDTASEITRNRPRGFYDNDPGYVRTEGAQKAGFCETFIYCLNRNGFAILLVLNMLLLFVNFAGLPYLALRVFQDGGKVVTPEKKPDCFNCNAMSYATKYECLRDGIIYKVDKQRCCFKSAENMTSWFVKQVSDRSKDRPFIYLTGSDYHHHKRTPKQRIQWTDRPTGPMEIAQNRTVVKVLEKGYYFIFSRVHYSGSGARSNSQLPTISHKIMKHTDPSRDPVTLETISQKCNVDKNSTAIEHNSVLETIVFLRENEHIFIDVNMTLLMGHIKNYTLGLFKLN